MKMCRYINKQSNAERRPGTGHEERSVDISFTNGPYFTFLVGPQLSFLVQVTIQVVLVDFEIFLFFVKLSFSIVNILSQSLFNYTTFGSKLD